MKQEIYIKKSIKLILFNIHEWINSIVRCIPKTEERKVSHHHQHLFLKRPFLQQSARVRRVSLSCYEASPLIPEHCPFLGVQTKLILIIGQTFSTSLPAPTRISVTPATSECLQADTQWATILMFRHAHTTLNLYHTSVTIWAHKRLYRTSLRFLSFRDTPHIHLTIIYALLSQADSQFSLPMSQSHMSTHSAHRP